MNMHGTYRTASAGERGIAISPSGIFTFLAAVVVILNSGYYRATASDSYLPLILLIGVAAVCLMFFHDRPIQADRKFIFVLLFAAGIGFSILANFSTPNLLSGGRVFVTALCCYVIIAKLEFDAFLKHFSRLMRIIIWAAFVLWVWANVMGAPLPALKYGNYYDFFLVTMKVAGGRAMGVFWEPGVFASMVILTMILELYFKKEKISLYRLVLYTVGVFLSGSTAGILILGILLIAYLWRRWGLEKHWFPNLVFVVLVIFGALYYEKVFELLYDLNPDIFGKLMETTSETTATRLNAPLVNLEIFLDSPVLGHGFTDAATLFADKMNVASDLNIVAQTSTSTQMMASVGILGIAYTVGLVFPLFAGKKSGLGFVSRVAIAAIMLLVTNKEPHVYIALTWIMMFVFMMPAAQEIEKK